MWESMRLEVIESLGAAGTSGVHIHGGLFSSDLPGCTGGRLGQDRRLEKNYFENSRPVGEERLILQGKTLSPSQSSFF